MSVTTNQLTPRVPEPDRRKRKRQKPSVGNAMLARGEPMIWLTGGALAISLLMIVSLLALVFWLGSGTFFPVEVRHVVLHDGTVFMGEVTKTEEFSLDAQGLVAEPEAITTAVVQQLVSDLGSNVDVVAAISQQLEDLNYEAAEREQYLTEKLAIIQQRVDRLRKELAPEDTSAFARSRHVQEFGDVEEYDGAHGFMLTIANELDASRAKQETNRQAIEYFRQHGSQSTDAAGLILAAPHAEKVAGLEALLRMKSAADGTRVAMGSRRQFRTGNYQLTGTHFNWVSDYQIKPEGESLPEWALVIERRAWGRFYGMPKNFRRTRVRELPAAEQQLVAAEAFFATHASRLESAERQQAVTAALTERRAAIADDVRQSINAFVAESADREQVSLLAVLADGQQVDADQREKDADVRSVIEVYEGEANAYQEFVAAHGPALARYEERRSLEKHDIGKANHVLEEARLAVRESEMAAGYQGALDLAKQMSDLARQIMLLEQDAEKVEQAAAEIKAAFGDSVLAAAAADIAKNIRQQTIEQTAGWREELQQFSADGEAMRNVPSAVQAAIQEYVNYSLDYTEATAGIQRRINDLKEEDRRLQLVMRTAQDQEKQIELGEIVRAYPANQLGLADKVGIHLSRAWEFLSDDPREANSEGGVFPAIWGTVAMTLIMSLAVAPFGVLSALYLSEYAKAGPIVSVIRISINNLAGVPSIVFGVFGLGFFCYGVGKWIDGGPANAGLEPLPAIDWWIGLAVSALIAVVAFAVHLIASAGHPGTNRRLKKALRFGSFVLWLAATAVVVVLIAKFPFAGFHAANLPNPFFGKGGILWASLTLALLTLPVVIVATEEAISAVPNSMREGSYGCGASKWQTIRRIVLPHALPGIMTGMILAMARGAGEVAPLMLVGAVKLAPELPLDAQVPFLHLERSFMHLGFHIFDLGFQSQNSEAAKPMVFTTTLLLIGIIACLNIAAVWLRGMLRKRFQRGQF